MIWRCRKPGSERTIRSPGGSKPQPGNTCRRFAWDPEHLTSKESRGGPDCLSDLSSKGPPGSFVDCAQFGRSGSRFLSGSRSSIAFWRHALVSLVSQETSFEPATRRGAGAAPNPEGCAGFRRVLSCSSVEDHSGYSPSSRRAPCQNPQQRCYTSNGLSALGTKAMLPRVDYYSADEAMNSAGKVS
jgi:hypothetical protein